MFHHAWTLKYLDILDDKGTVGKDSLAVIDRKLPALALPDYGTEN